MLRAWAGTTRGITLGVGVLALDRHEPAAIASRLGALELPQERLLVGLGAGFSEHPLEAVRRGVGALRESAPGLRIAVAAMGPAMCRLGGEVGDAVLLNWMTPARAAWAEALVREGAARAGRERGQVMVYAYVRTALGDTAPARLADEAAFYTRLPHYARHFDAMGGEPGVVGIAASDEAQVGPGLEEYDAIDVPVVRALTERSSEAVLELARVAMGERTEARS